MPLQPIHPVSLAAGSWSVSDALPFFAVSISSYAYTFVGTVIEMNTTTKAANNAIVFLMNILDITIPPFIIPLKMPFYRHTNIIILVQMLQVQNLILSALCDYKYPSRDKTAGFRQFSAVIILCSATVGRYFMYFADPQSPAVLSRDRRRSPVHTADRPFAGSRY